MEDIAGKKKKGKVKKKKATVANSQKQKMKGRVGNALRSLQRNLDRGHLKEVGPQRSAAESIIKISGAQKNETIVSVPTSPPAVVVVMGPRGVGKSTLIRSLVKLFTRQNLVNTTGPITVCCSSASKRRVTLIECPSDDLLAMVDLAKIADLALLLVDGSYGLQMETFEFLNLLQLHGFPKVAGVLTNLDCPRFQKNRTALQTVRKSVKQRLWTESHKGNKMFEFCGGLTGGKYKKNEVQRLALFVSRVKFRPLVWRNAHPYVLVDRIELLPQRNGKKENDTNTRDVTLFGYVRGSRLRSGGSVHLAGAGDFSLDFDAVSALPDPCPLASSSTNGGAFQKDSVKEKKKNKSAALHAPMADSGRVSVDREGGLSIELRTVTYTKKEMLPLIHQAQINQDTDRGVVSNGQPTPVDLLRSMQDVSHSLDQQLKGSKGNLQLFAGEGQRGHDEYDGHDSIGDDDDDNRHDNESAIDDSEYENAENDGPEVDDNEDEDGSDDDSDDEDEDGSDDDEGEIYDEKNNLWSDDDEGEDEDVEKDRSRPSANSTDAHSSSRIDWMTEVYGKDWINKSNHKKDGNNKVRKELDSDDEELGGLFKLVGKNRSNSDEKSNLQRFNEIDSSRSFLVVGQKRNPIMSNEESNTHEILRNWVGEAVSKLDEEDQAGDRSSEDSGEKVSANSSSLLQLLKLRYVTGGWLQSTLSASDNDNTVAKRSDKSQSGDVDGSDDEDEMEKMNLKIDADLRKENASRKAAFKASFDLKYDQGKIDSNGKKRRGGDDDDDGEKDEEGVDSDDQSDDGKGSRNGKGKGRKGARGGGITQQEIEEEEAMMKERAEAIKQQMAMVQERNKREFSEEGSSIRQQQLAGFGQGTYVRLLLRGVPAEFAEYFRPHTPLLLGGLLAHETVPQSAKDTGVNGLDMGYLTARVKRHRWHKRILKSNDPLIFSIGWRRFQAMPLYSIRDANQRQRFLKYTPEHMHCEASFCGPAVAPNTGIIAFQTISNSSSGFRIALSGTVLEHRATCEVVKKLKLVGTPLKVFKNTAFIKGMFSSALEVAKFEHAKIKTVSGIRGSIKRALTHDAPAGSFRASFEDKILLSDLVICRLWVPVMPPPLFNPVLSLLAPTAATKKESEMRALPSNNSFDGVNDDEKQPHSEEGGDNRSNSTGSMDERTLPLMRTTAQLRKDLKVPQVVAKDSVYKPIQRAQRVFTPLHVSAKLQSALPFASKPKETAALNKQSYLQRRKVILEPEERKQRAVVQMLGAVKNQKVEKRVAANKKRLQSKKDTFERQAAKFEDVHKSEKKRKYTDIGKEQLARERKKAR